MTRRTGKLNLALGLFLLAMTFPFSVSAQEAEAANKTVAEEQKPEKKEKEKPVLTGNPQLDYIHDPNLPRELKGYDLSDYPFYKRVPDVHFNFTCDGRHDGFYASIPHKCQVYHNCLFGDRYDFVCANYTAFDQSNFICHFASEVDCENSELHYDRNNALYKEETTTTTKPPPPQIKVVYVERPFRKRLGTKGGRRKRPTPKPSQDDYYYDDYHYDERDPSAITDSKLSDDYYYYYDEPSNKKATTTTTTSTTARPPTLIKRRPNRPLKRPLKTSETNLGRQRPNIRQSAANKDQTVPRRPSRRQRPENQERPLRKRRRRKKTTTPPPTTTTTTTPPTTAFYDDYYDYEYYYDDAETTTTTTTTREPPRRRPGQGGRRSAQERRKALLQSRKSQLRGSAQQGSSSRTAQGGDAVDVQYDDAALAEDAASVVSKPLSTTGVDYEYDVTPERGNQNRGINARRPGAFKRPRNRRLQNRTPEE